MAGKAPGRPQNRPGAEMAWGRSGPSAGQEGPFLRPDGAARPSLEGNPADTPGRAASRPRGSARGASPLSRLRRPLREPLALLLAAVPVTRPVRAAWTPPPATTGQAAALSASPPTRTPRQRFVPGG